MKDFKTGFKNARTLSQHEPDLLDKMIDSKDLNKDFVKGLEAGKKGFKIRQTMQRIKNEREQQQREIDRDLGMGY